MKTYTLPIISTLLAAISACSLLPVDFATKTELTVVCQPEEYGTKTIEIDDSLITDLNLFVFDSVGHLTFHTYTTSRTISLVLPAGDGADFIFYCLANTGDLSSAGFSSENELLRYRYSIGSYEELASASSSVPMSGVVDRKGIEDGMIVTIPLKRCISAIELTIDKSRLSAGHQFEITSATLHNSPTFVSPLDSSKVTSDSERFESGDTATPAQVSALDDGQSIQFYMFENLQGRLLEENHLQSGKVFASSDSRSRWCSYLELGVDYNDGLLSGPVLYRFYLGSDMTGDFSVERNCIYHITVTPSDNGIDEESWRIDKSRLTPVEIPVTPISLTADPSSDFIFGNAPEGCPYYYSSFPLKSTAEFSDGTSAVVTGECSYVSSDPTIVAVSDGGLVKHVDDGDVSINVSYTKNGVTVSDTCAVYAHSFERFEIRASSPIEIGESCRPSAYIYDNFGYDWKAYGATFSSSHISILTNKGVGVSGGTAMLTANWYGWSDSAEITVNGSSDPDPVAVTSILLEPDPLYLHFGESATVSATVLPSDADDVSLTWSSSLSQIATVSDGEVTAGHTEGRCKVTATANDGSGVSASIDVIVTDWPEILENVVIEPGSATIKEDETIRFSAIAIYAKNGVESRREDVSSLAGWSSSDETVATVSGGLAYAESAGSCSIVASYGGYEPSAPLTVTARPAVPTDFDISINGPTELYDGYYGTYAIEVHEISNASGEPAITWIASSNEFALTDATSSVTSGGRCGIHLEDLLSTVTYTISVTVEINGVVRTAEIDVDVNPVFNLIDSETDAILYWGGEDNIVTICHFSSPEGFSVTLDAPAGFDSYPGEDGYITVSSERCTANDRQLWKLSHIAEDGRTISISDEILLSEYAFAANEQGTFLYSSPSGFVRTNNTSMHKIYKCRTSLNGQVTAHFTFQQGDMAASWPRTPESMTTFYFFNGDGSSFTELRASTALDQTFYWKSHDNDHLGYTYYNGIRYFIETFIAPILFYELP